MIDDVFCKIVKGELPTTKVYEDEDFMVIKDIHPQAPVHLVLFPKQHLFGLGEAAQAKEPILDKMLLVAAKAAQAAGVADTGYRLIINEGPDSQREVPHLHAHLLAGTALGPKLVHQKGGT